MTSLCFIRLIPPSGLEISSLWHPSHEDNFALPGRDHPAEAG